MVNIWSIVGRSLGAHCQLCSAPGDAICNACKPQLPQNTAACAICALPMPMKNSTGLVCGACQRRRPSFDRAIAPLLYQQPVDDLVAGLKYHHRLHLALPLAECLVDALIERNGHGRDAWPDLVVPVPMHRAHLRERGFNQASELARVVSRSLNLPLSTSLLSRLGEARHQRGLKRAQRLARPGFAFAATGRCPPHVAVVDDVITTGATAEQVSLALRRAGAKRVEVWAIARTPDNR